MVRCDEKFPISARTCVKCYSGIFVCLQIFFLPLIFWFFRILSLSLFPTLTTTQSRPYGIDCLNLPMCKLSTLKHNTVFYPAYMSRVHTLIFAMTKQVCINVSCDRKTQYIHSFKQLLSKSISHDYLL